MTKKSIKEAVKKDLSYLVENMGVKILDIDIDEELVNVVVKGRKHDYDLIMYRVNGDKLNYVGMKDCF